MTTNSYPHGSYRRYCDGCRCQPCKIANNIYKQRLLSRRRRGEVISIPRPRVRRHLQQLLDHGATVHGIATAAGIHADSVWAALDETITRPIPARPARKLLAVSIDSLPDSALVDAKFAHDVIDQLLAAGETRNKLATKVMGWGSWPGLDYPANRVTLGVVRKLRAHLEQVTRERCETCDAEPWAGGRWCRSCYFEQTAHITGEAV